FSNRAGDCITTRSGGFLGLVQRYRGLDFGLPSSWEAISGDFDGDGWTDYARLGDTGAFVFFSNGDGSFATVFQGYQVFQLNLSFGLPSP
ncbi:FG-GAP repeat domain-containing protein, partial [Streptococcus pyogenes]